MSTMESSPTGPNAAADADSTYVEVRDGVLYVRADQEGQFVNALAELESRFDVGFIPYSCADEDAEAGEQQS